MLREIFYQQFADIKPSEWPRALLLSSFFFMVIATYWILKPLKRGVIISFFGDDPIQVFGMTLTGAEAEQLGKVFNLVLVYLAVLLFTFLARRLPRHFLVLMFAALFAASFAFFATVIDEPTAPVVWSFYMLGDLFNTIMVALFWTFADDLVLEGEARRTYGIIGLGGVVGGFLGATAVQQGVEHVGRAPLLLVCVGTMAVLSVIAVAAHRRTHPEEHAEPPGADLEGTQRRSAALEGMRLVLSSKYLIAIAAIIGCYELISNVIDFQLASTVEREIESSLERDQFFALIGIVVGGISIVVQLLLTSVILKRFGVKVALFFLPIMILVTTFGYLALPSLLFAAAMSVSDNSFNYSINQTAREALYIPTSKEVKYKAKAFIDMFVQRFAKVVSVAINLIFVSEFVLGVRLLSLVTIGVTLIWLVLIHFVNKGFQIRSTEER